MPNFTSKLPEFVFDITPDPAELNHPQKPVHFEPQIPELGILGTFFDQDDPRPAIDQVNEHYAHGGGWQEMSGFTVALTGSQCSRGEGLYCLCYTGDPDMVELSRGVFRDQLIVLFPYSWVMIVDRDDMSQHSIARLD